MGPSGCWLTEMAVQSSPFELAVGWELWRESLFVLPAVPFVEIVQEEVEMYR